MPETRDARSGDVEIAFQTVGEGPIDLVWVAGFVTHLDVLWEDPSYWRFCEQLGAFSRLIMFDKQGWDSRSACAWPRSRNGWTTSVP